ncbi:MAG: hypothetical protein M2R45_02675 [Verrucomicrobia subdivision 3 bacterium]|nr:hypothetical protein [Limisphaerales bacterium]MCS1414051.1 hypothetical protein [Limisphaerales bacterium]
MPCGGGRIEPEETPWAKADENGGVDPSLLSKGETTWEEEAAFYKGALDNEGRKAWDEYMHRLAGFVGEQMLENENDPAFAALVNDAGRWEEIEFLAARGMRSRPKLKYKPQNGNAPRRRQLECNNRKSTRSSSLLQGSAFFGEPASRQESEGSRST